MLQDFQIHIEKNFPFLKNKKLLVAISGGIDSVVLSHLLKELQQNITLAHCNFKLRESESDLDEEFVIDFARTINAQVYTKKFNTESIAKDQKESIQVTARKLRYQWFNELIEEFSFDYLLTAHHADDNLETFFINLTRGSGLDGLIGIPTQNANIIRPLLSFSREAIEEYAKKNKLIWREDQSNASTKYIRNKIRHLIVPVLKEINPSLLESFQNTLDYLNQSKAIVAEKTNEVFELAVTYHHKSAILKINIPKLQTFQNPKVYLYEILKGYGFTEWNDVYHLMTAQSGKQVFSKTYRLLKDREELILTEKDITKNQTILQIDKGTMHTTSPIFLNFEIVNQKLNHSKNCIYLDKDLLNYPLFVRKWKEGDFFYPSGMHGKKKVSKYFKDEKFSLIDKQNVWLLCDVDDQIIWIINHRQDRRFMGKENLKITTQ